MPESAAPQHTSASPGSPAQFSQTRYLDVLLSTLDQALAGAELADRERFLIDTARRTLVRFATDRTPNPGYAETGIVLDRDVVTLEDDELAALVLDEGDRLDESIRVADERLAAGTASAVLDAVCTEDVEKALSQLGHPGAVVRSMHVAPGGRSKETVLLSVDGVDGLPSELVLRRDLRANTLGTSVVREYALLQALYAAGVRIPRPYVLVEDVTVLGSSFILLERIAGSASGKSLLSPAPSPNEALAAARALGGLHGTAVSVFDDALKRAGTPPPRAIERADVEAFAAEWRQRARGSSPAAEAALRWMSAQCPVPVDDPVLVHGDFSFHNLLFDGGQLSAVLDWELAHAGHPGEDLGYIKAAVTAVLPWEQFMAEYRAAGGPDVPLRSVRFFALYATIRLLIWTLRGRDLFEAGVTDDPLKSDLAAFMLPRVMQKLSREMRDIVEAP
jgi:aminoglycoside phosphotransferase (APT) family kinase protein